MTRPLSRRIRSQLRSEGMPSRGERRAAALEVITHGLLELAALEREPQEGTHDVSVQPSVVPAQRGVRARGQRTPDRPLPPGMTAWVSAEDVARAVSCSRSKAHEYLRAAAGRGVGTGQLLRVPVDVWEAWARDHLVDGPRHERRGTGRAPPRASTPTCATTKGPSPTRRRNLGPWAEAMSKLPLIPLLITRKR
jgi:hypothetical protein